MDNRVAILIRRARKSLGLTLEDVAKQVHMTPGALSHIENGKRLPDPKNAVRIAYVLRIAEEDMMQALDEDHALRRRQYASPESYHSDERPAPSRMAAVRSADFIQPHAYQDEGWIVDSLYVAPAAASPSAAPASLTASSPRTRARWSDNTSERLAALEQLATSASEAIRTLRGLLDDENPKVAKEARRLLRELDVRTPDEDR